MDNDCPFEWDVDDSHDERQTCKLIFSENDN